MFQWKLGSQFIIPTQHFLSGASRAPYPSGTYYSGDCSLGGNNDVVNDVGIGLAFEMCNVFI